MLPDLDVLVVGEALVDVVRGVDGQIERRHAGGSPANVALGLARLGRAVGLITQLGDDGDGDLVRRHLASAGVDVHAAPTSTGRTSTAIVDLDGSGAATYTFDLAWTLATKDVTVGRNPAVVHTGSIAAFLDPGASVVESIALDHRGRAAITYDPNLRPDLLGDPDTVRQRVERLVAAADVVKASDEDLGWLYPSAPVEQVVRTWATSGPALVVVTRGGAEALAVHGTTPHRVTPAPIAVVDTVGAGDSFMSGLIDGLIAHHAVGPAARARIAALDHAAVGTILHRAAAAAAVAVSRLGADPPTAAELA